MGTAFNSFDQYALGHYDGQVEDRSLADIVSRVASGGDIGYGVAVADNSVRSARIVTGYDVPSGITVRETVRDNPVGDDPTPVYSQDHEMSVLRVGRIWVTTKNGAADGHPVYAVPDTGELTDDPNGSATALADSSNTGDGAIGSLGAINGAIIGNYVAVCTAAAVDGGTFRVHDPRGVAIGEVDVGVAFDDGVQFTISDGAADFVVGDRFNITVTGANRLMREAAFKTAAAAGERALIQVNG